MSESKHTPGLWRHVPGILKDYVTSEDGELSCSIQQLHPSDGRDVPAAANCQLIAAAPELYEACKAALEYIEEFGNHAGDDDTGDCFEDLLYKQLSAAIAKAEGRKL